jgi:hypothetical protein
MEYLTACLEEAIHGFVTESSLNVHWMFTECSLNVHWMFTEYSLNVPWMNTLQFASRRRYPGLLLNVYGMFSECSLNVRWMFTECSLNVHWMFIECSLNDYLAVCLEEAVCGFVTESRNRKAHRVLEIWRNILSPWLPIGYKFGTLAVPGFLLVKRWEYSQSLASYWSYVWNILSPYWSHVRNILSPGFLFVTPISSCSQWGFLFSLLESCSCWWIPVASLEINNCSHWWIAALIGGSLLSLVDFCSQNPLCRTR